MAAVQPLVTGGRPRAPPSIVTIIGGGDVGFRLAQRLEKNPQIELRVIERDTRRGELLAATLRRAARAERRRHRPRTARVGRDRPQRRARVRHRQRRAQPVRLAPRTPARRPQIITRVSRRPTSGCSNASASTSRSRRAAPPSPRSSTRSREGGPTCWPFSKKGRRPSSSSPCRRASGRDRSWKSRPRRSRSSAPSCAATTSSSREAATNSGRTTGCSSSRPQQSVDAGARLLRGATPEMRVRRACVHVAGAHPARVRRSCSLAPLGVALFTANSSDAGWFVVAGAVTAAAGQALRVAAAARSRPTCAGSRAWPSWPLAWLLVAHAGRHSVRVRRRWPRSTRSSSRCQA